LGPVDGPRVPVGWYTLIIRGQRHPTGSHMGPIWDGAPDHPISPKMATFMEDGGVWSTLEAYLPMGPPTGAGGSDPLWPGSLRTPSYGRRWVGGPVLGVVPRPPNHRIWASGGGPRPLISPILGIYPLMWVYEWVIGYTRASMGPCIPGRTSHSPGRVVGSPPHPEDIPGS
jgi:hypothetical protein